MTGARDNRGFGDRQGKGKDVHQPFKANLKARGSHWQFKKRL